MDDDAAGPALPCAVATQWARGSGQGAKQIIAARCTADAVLRTRARRLPAGISLRGPPMRVVFLRCRHQDGSAAHELLGLSPLNPEDGHLEPSVWKRTTLSASWSLRTTPTRGPI